MMKPEDIKKLVRPHLLNVKPYSSARDEFTGKSEVYLDANENSLGSVSERDLSRYPDPHQREIKNKLSAIKNLKPENIFIGNGSDEPIDLLIRAFCEPGRDEIIILPPTYGMYQVSANISNVQVKAVNLTPDYQLDTERIIEALSPRTKIIFTCNPNNPTGNRVSDKAILHLLKNFRGLVVVDEAYIDFSSKKSFTERIGRHNNLVVLQTFSKAWGLAAARVGMLFGSPEVVGILNKIKPPYNVNQMSQEVVSTALDLLERKDQMVTEILKERSILHKTLSKLPIIQKVYETDTNFILLKVKAPVKLYNFLVGRGVIVRNRSKVTLCEGCLRITVGTQEENQKLIQEIKAFF